MSQFRSGLKDVLTRLHQHGDFKLSHGGRADDYFDLAPLFLSPYGLRLVSHEAMHAVCELEFDAIGCLELCPVPLLGAILVLTLVDKRGFVVRKTRKGHGTNRLIEGDLRAGDRVVIIEDVTSTGQSVMKVVRAVEEADCGVVSILTIINRQEGCGKLLGDYDFRWLYTKEEL